MATSETAVQTARKFCRHYLGKGCFAPFTGQDYSAWAAFCYLVECYGRGDIEGRERSIAAMREVLLAAQTKGCIMQVFLQSIPAILDWSDGPRIWEQIVPPSSRIHPRFGASAAEIADLTVVNEAD